MNKKQPTEYNAYHICVFMNEKGIEYLELLPNRVPPGPYVNEKDKNGCTPLHYASAQDNYYSVKLLLNYGSKPDIQNVDGDTPVDIANELENANSLKAFKEFGINTDVKKDE